MGDGATVHDHPLSGTRATADAVAQLRRRGKGLPAAAGRPARTVRRGAKRAGLPLLPLPRAVRPRHGCSRTGERRLADLQVAPDRQDLRRAAGDGHPPVRRTEPDARRAGFRHATALLVQGQRHPAAGLPRMGTARARVREAPGAALRTRRSAQMVFRSVERTEPVGILVGYERRVFQTLQSECRRAQIGGRGPAHRRPRLVEGQLDPGHDRLLHRQRRTAGLHFDAPLPAGRTGRLPRPQRQPLRRRRVFPREDQKREGDRRELEAPRPGDPLDRMEHAASSVGGQGYVGGQPVRGRPARRRDDRAQLRRDRRRCTDDGLLGAQRHLRRGIHSRRTVFMHLRADDDPRHPQGKLQRLRTDATHGRRPDAGRLSRSHTTGQRHHGHRRGRHRPGIGLEPEFRRAE